MASNMQAQYPKKLQTIKWDTLNLEYPVKKFPDTGLSSKTMAHSWIPPPETVRQLKTPVPEVKDYYRDFNVTQGLTKSQSMVDFGSKLPETQRFNKHTSCDKNLYIYPPSRRLSEAVPMTSAHGTTEMRSAYTPPVTPARLVTDKDQFRHPSNHVPRPPMIEPSWHTELPPLDTTHEGFEKYLDPYLTTSRLHHRPYTDDQLQRISNSKDVVTYYTYADITWTRTPKPEIGNWRLPLSKPKTVYDRTKFKEGFREIWVPHKLNWVPGSFRTESTDNFIPVNSQPETKIRDMEEKIRELYHRKLAHLSTSTPEELSSILNIYKSENQQTGSRKPLCSVLNQFKEKNQRLERNPTKTK